MLYPTLSGFNSVAQCQWLKFLFWWFLVIFSFGLNSDIFGSWGFNCVEITGTIVQRCLPISSCAGLYPFSMGVRALLGMGHCSWSIAPLLFWQLFQLLHWLEGIWGCLLHDRAVHLTKKSWRILRSIIRDHYFRDTVTSKIGFRCRMTSDEVVAASLATLM